MRSVKIVTTLDRKPNYLLDLWIKHHLQYFSPECFIFSLNLISPDEIQSCLLDRYGIDSDIITNLSDLGKVRKCAIYKNPSSNITNYDYFVDYSSDLANQIQNGLIESGIDVVIWLDMDELLYHKNLVRLIQNFQEPVLRTIGVEIVQNIDEATYNADLPIKQQRKYIKYYSSKNKPIITKRSVSWIPGRHGCDEFPHGCDTDISQCYPDLYLIHLDKLDVDLLFKIKQQDQTMYAMGSRTFNRDAFDNMITINRQSLMLDKKIIKKLKV